MSVELSINEVICNAGAERVVLSNCINDQNILIECESEGLLPKHFAIKGNQIIYNTMVYLLTKNVKTDPITIWNVLKDESSKQEVEKLGGLEYLMLLQQSPKTYNVSMFCQEIMTNNLKRDVYNMCNGIQQHMVKTTDKDNDTILGFVNQQLMDITLASSKIADAYKMGDSLDERMKRYIDNPTDVPGLRVGMEKFDRATRGGIGGDCVIVCAESKTGKSVLLMNWARHIAIDQQLPILWVDSEQSNEEEELRLVSSMSQVPEDEIKTGMFAQDTAWGTAQEKITRLNFAKRLLKDSNFHHIYMSDFTLEKIGAVARKFHLKYGIVALFFDYIKLNPVMMAQYKGMRTDLMLTALTTGLKNIAGDLQIPVFTAAQENRSGYGNQDKDARNIGESLGILQLATKLCFLRNMSDEEIACSPHKANQELILAYQRHGASDVRIPILYKKPVLTQIEAS